MESALKEGILTEAFGTGTAATIAHIAKINVNGTDYILPEKDQNAFSHQVLKKLDDIKYGKVEDTHDWIFKV